ncbi:bifunctional DNA primase/polymerase [Streptomyces spectabilis]|uniref:DNA primase n=1 Tax=Streptomyces spectabilis TaxID=68270 RepID=A0A5P2X2A3_STRST|nr:bifunctional DNA primase/polymerase [Streptomyces spectabilis]MBB5108294.1 primase-polymerase (primpol)-like protein [Streptomyces spectabilis]MCI3901054.1 bifunctional DNA primase/polymerase [Streptomyces spectabilis]QEV58551.1 DNA primase [Streptomyces spectabilis]
MPETLRSCEHCGGDLPVMHRSDRRYCSNSHRVLAARARKRERDAVLAAEQQARIPAELTSRPRWVRHKDKVPMRTDGRFASVKDPSSWSDYAAVAASNTGDGVGFVLTAGDGIVVVDLDHAVEDGSVLPWAQAIVDRLPPTYMERGRSGTGLHLWFRGAVPHGRRIRKGELAFEVYSDRRYIIVGDRVPGTPLSLAVLPDAAGLIASL